LVVRVNGMAVRDDAQGAQGIEKKIANLSRNINRDVEGKEDDDVCKAQCEPWN
jgi:hypothetical protein